MPEGGSAILYYTILYYTILYYTGGIDCETFYLCLFVLFVDSYCSIR